MYARYFGLKQPPFSIAPDPRYLFMSERHREALAHLLYGVRGGGGFVLLTGEIGAGKTTVCRCLLEQIPKRCNVAYIFNPKLTVEELLRTICAEFRIPYTHPGPGTPTVKDYVDALNEYLLRTHAVGQNNVLIIDEAQNLSADVLEQLRLLTNLETSERKLLQIVLIGQPELRAMLSRPQMQQLAQRVIARYHLEPLGESETGQYVRHRLSVAGLTRSMPFDRRAMRRIYQYSRGVPRRINLLCDRALLGAYANGRTGVDRGTVEKAAREVLDQPEFMAIRRSRYERAAMLGAGVAAGAVLVGAVTFLLDRRVDPQPATAGDPAPSSLAVPAIAGVVTGSGAAAASTASGAAGSAAPPVAELPPFDLATGFASLVGAEKDSWRELAGSWNAAPGDGDPCTTLRKQQLACYRGANVTLALIRSLDRPGILTLRDGANRSAHVMLTGLSNDAATLRIDGTDRIVPLIALADYWRGDYATLWRAPPEYSGTVIDGRSAPAARWLALQLATARGDVRPVGARVDDASLRAGVHAFQLTQGLPSDGVAGPVTLMHLNRAIGIDEPHLQKGK
jgi:general secretion pathway protein A